MALRTLNDFFSNDSEEDRALFLHEGDVFTKAQVTSLIKKQMVAIRNFKGSEVILATQDNFRFIIGFFALLHSNKTIILASNLRENTLNAIGVRKVLSDIDIISGGQDVEIHSFSPEDSRVVFFTSGSTGEPKRIQKTFHSLFLELASVDALLSQLLREETVALATVSMFHLFGMTFSFLYSMASGFLIDTTLIGTPESLIESLNKHKNTFLISSPMFLDSLGRYRDVYAFKSKPYLIVTSGAPLSRDGAMASRELFGISPIEVFGSTETGVIANRKQLEDEKWALFPYAKAHTDSEGRLVVTSDYTDYDKFVMGDAVEFVDNDHFILKGRIDRMVKIDAKRVSLPESEVALSAHSFVRNVHCMAIKDKNGRIRVGACVCLNDAGRDYLISWGHKKTVKHLKDYMTEYVDKTAVPSRWRFVDEIPVNEQSKILSGEINAIMKSDLTEPVVVKKNTSENQADYEIVFLSENICFSGHFPVHAILPGVAQIHFADHFAHLNWKINGNLREIQKLKFSQIIMPLQKVKLVLKRSGKEVFFKYCDKSDMPCSSGILWYV
ncbi:MAG: AMP-binding protein [Holophagaceae bacterium]|nr:AMP-binding protein [Holophagaceae bacterium]